MRNTDSNRFPKGVHTEQDGNHKVEHFPSKMKWSEVKAAIFAAHPAIRPLLFTDENLGLRLMRRESTVMSAVVVQLIAKGIGFVPLHDGVLCPASKAQVVEKAMALAYSRFVNGKTPTIKIKEKSQ